MTSNDLKEWPLGQNFILVIESAQGKNILREIARSHKYFRKKQHMNISPLPYNGEVSEFTWPQVTEIKIPR